ncbi:MAG: hypothetical protein QM503_00095 [Bacteroidota bacterium]
MKKLILSLFVLVALTVLTNNAMAQYGIPSYDVPVIADPTTFEETTSYNFTKTLSKPNPFIQKPTSRGEKMLTIIVRNQDVQTTAWVSIEIYTINESITYGPYTVYEGTPLEQSLSTEYEWGVRVLTASTGCEMSVWFN